VFNYPFPQNTNTIKRKIRLVEYASCGYGDFVLCEILGPPIPPHINPYYAGWATNLVGVPPMASVVIPNDFINFSHPNASIKQYATTLAIRDGLMGNIVQNSCKTVTKVLDFALGWIWGRRWSFETVCEVIQIPFADPRYTVPNWNVGTVHSGSSGSALFTGNNRIVGTYSGAIYNNCNSGAFWFGRLPSYYYNSKIKYTLNPENKFWVDQTGIEGRNRNCYDVIDYNYGQRYDLYPAKYYQRENALTFNSRTDVYLGRDLVNEVNIKREADFTFNAGGSVILGPGFTAEAGSNFTARAGISCNPSSSYRIKYENEGFNDYEKIARQELFDRMMSINLPEFLDLTDKLETKSMAVSVFPNPAKDKLHLYIGFIPNKSIKINMLDVLGKIVYENNLVAENGIEVEIPLDEIPEGLYQIVLTSGYKTSNHRIVVKK
jgi:hypothetical protein